MSKKYFLDKALHLKTDGFIACVLPSILGLVLLSVASVSLYSNPIFLGFVVVFWLLFLFIGILLFTALSMKLNDPFFSGIISALLIGFSCAVINRSITRVASSLHYTMGELTVNLLIALYFGLFFGLIFYWRK